MNDVDRGLESQGEARVERTRTGAYLTHFSPDGADLGEAHLQWLRGFAGRVKTLTGDLYIVGLVDPGAGEAGGRALARRRARAVYRFVRSASHTFPLVEVHVTTSGRGIEGSAAEAPARNRGVALVHVAPGERGGRWLRAVVQEFPEPARAFYIRLVVAEAPSGEALGEEEAARESERPEHRAAFELNDGRWSVLYELSAPGPGGVPGPPGGSGGEAARPIDLGRAAGGPWHCFTSPFDLTVADFHRSPVMASGLLDPGEGVHLHLLRPPLTVAPFRTGGTEGVEALRAAVPVGAEVEPGGRAPLGRLDARGRGPFQRPISPPIRHHLRRGGAPGPRTREGAGQTAGPGDRGR